MTEKPVSLLRALREGWAWMVQMLFRPFDLGKWLVVAFSAWLAGLADCSGGGGGGGGNDFSDETSGPEIVESARQGWEWLTAHELVVGLIVGGCLALLALFVLLVWISSRGKFIFLDNVVHDRAQIVVPWKRYRRLGNSLFAFRLVAGIVLIPLVLAFGGLTAWLVVGASGSDTAAVAGAVAAGVLAALLFVVGLYAYFFLDAFVVPLMHRFDLGVLDAWRRFFGLFTAHPWWFLGSGLFVYGLLMLALIVILTTGIVTCCLGFLLLAVPYVGTVLLLPLLVAYRAFTVAFLAQLEPEATG